MSRQDRRQVEPIKTVDPFKTSIPEELRVFDYAQLPEPILISEPKDIDPPLPTYAPRPPQRIAQPLAPVFTDMECKRPGTTYKMRQPLDRNFLQDPIYQISQRLPLPQLYLGTVPLEEYVAEVRSEERETTKIENVAPTPQKRQYNQYAGTMSEQKRQRGRVLAYSEVYQHNDDVVAPENVLRMVDSSLVDTPEKDEYAAQVRSSAPGPSPKPAGPLYAYDEKGQDNIPRPEVHKPTFAAFWQRGTDMPPPGWRMKTNQLQNR